MDLGEGLTNEITRRVLLNRERRHIKGVHFPECNERCDGDWHYLLSDGPQGSAFAHQSED